MVVGSLADTPQPRKASAKAKTEWKMRTVNTKPTRRSAEHQEAE